MKKKIHFTKMHGAGNDYIYVNTLFYNIDEPSELARLWSDRHKGIGSDGLVLIGRSPIPEADFSMRIFNADGSEAMMCGNACRCIGKYLYERTHLWPLPCMEGNGYQETTIRLLTLSGIKLLFLHIVNGIVESVTVDMGEPAFDSPLFKPLPQGGEALAANLPSPRRGVGGEALDSLFVSMGNPHYVVFTDDVDAVEVQGRELEHHPAFPERANIEFAEMPNLPKCVLTAFGFAFGSAEVVSRWLAGQEPVLWLWLHRRQDEEAGRAASSWTVARSMSNGESKTIMSILLARQSSCLKERLKYKSENSEYSEHSELSEEYDQREFLEAIRVLSLYQDRSEGECL